MNAVCLPGALRFNQEAVPEAVGGLAEALGDGRRAATRVEELARLGGFERLRDFGVPGGRARRRSPPRSSRGRARRRTRGRRRRRGRRRAPALDLVADDVDRRGRATDHPSMAEYALVTTMVAIIALAIGTIPDALLAKRLPTTAAKAQALVSIVRPHSSSVGTGEGARRDGPGAVRVAPRSATSSPRAGSAARRTRGPACSRRPRRTRRRTTSRRRSAAITAS